MSEGLERTGASGASPRPRRRADRQPAAGSRQQPPCMQCRNRAKAAPNSAPSVWSMPFSSSMARSRSKRRAAREIDSRAICRTESRNGAWGTPSAHAMPMACAQPVGRALAWQMETALACLVDPQPKAYLESGLLQLLASLRVKQLAGRGWCLICPRRCLCGNCLQDGTMRSAHPRPAETGNGEGPPQQTCPPPVLAPPTSGCACPAALCIQPAEPLGPFQLHGQWGEGSWLGSSRHARTCCSPAWSQQRLQAHRLSMSLTSRSPNKVIGSPSARSSLLTSASSVGTTTAFILRRNSNSSMSRCCLLISAALDCTRCIAFP